MSLIRAVRTRVRREPLRAPFITALRTVTEIEAVAVEVQDADGRIGIGEAVATGPITGDLAGGIVAALDGPLRTAVLGRDIEDFEDLLRAVDAAVVGNHSAKAALDIALHDLRARTYGVPLHRLLGCGRASVGSDVTISVEAPRAMAEQAAARVADGFGTLKLKVADDPAIDVERVRRIRDTVGPEVRLRLDANQGWSAKQAVAIMTELERAEIGIEFLEQPVPAADLAGLAFVAQRIATPVMADESAATAADVLRIVEARAAEIINVKLMKCGGLRPARAIIDIAAAGGLSVLIGGMMETAVGVGAAASLAATLPDGLVHDVDPAWWLARSPLRYENGQLLLPADPGLAGCT
ncbi:MAG TPA: dipeptide epimerase [Mycobacteriales bacterium]|nr:dipeptide epimerase [Mycobacteriales bacterium]